MTELRSRTRSSAPAASFAKTSVDNIRIDNDGNDNSKLFFGRSSGRVEKGPIETAIQLIKHQWALLPFHSKMVAFLSLLAFASYTIVGMIDVCFHHQLGGLDDGTEIIQSLSTKEETFSSFSVVIDSTSSEHPTSSSMDVDVLRQTVQHYADSCGKAWGVDHVYIMIPEEDMARFTNTSFFWLQPQLITSSSTSRNADRRRRNRAQTSVAPVDPVAPHKRFLNLTPFHNNSSSSQSIFLVDHNVRVHCRALGKGFQSFQRRPNFMSGFYPRLALPNTNHDNNNNNNNNNNNKLTMQYYSWPTVFWRHHFNFVLTKACFLHKRYLTLYASDNNNTAINTYVNNDIRTYVLQHKQCEKFALPMFVAAAASHYVENSTHQHATTDWTTTRINPRVPAIYVEGWVSEDSMSSVPRAIVSVIHRFFWLGGNNGGMMEQSDECLSDLNRLFTGFMGDSPLARSPVLLKEHSYLRHSPGFFWQSRPANFLEWFARD